MTDSAGQAQMQRESTSPPKSHQTASQKEEAASCDQEDTESGGANFELRQVEVSRGGTDQSQAKPGASCMMPAEIPVADLLDHDGDDNEEVKGEAHKTQDNDAVSESDERRQMAKAIGKHRLGAAELRQLLGPEVICGRKVDGEVMNLIAKDPG